MTAVTSGEISTSAAAAGPDGTSRSDSSRQRDDRLTGELLRVGGNANRRGGPGGARQSRREPSGYLDSEPGFSGADFVSSFISKGAPIRSAQVFFCLSVNFAVIRFSSS